MESVDATEYIDAQMFRLILAFAAHVILWYKVSFLMEYIIVPNIRVNIIVPRR